MNSNYNRIINYAVVLGVIGFFLGYSFFFQSPNGWIGAIVAAIIFGVIGLILGFIIQGILDFTKK